MDAFSYDGAAFSEEPQFDQLKNSLQSHILLTNASKEKGDQVRAAAPQAARSANSRRDSSIPFQMPPPTLSIPPQQQNAEKLVSS